MPIEILMPALSPTMTEGNLTKWVKKEGDTVKPGQVIAEIETDKATMEVEAVDEGVIGKIVIQQGSSAVKVNSVIAVLLVDGEDKSVLDNYKITQPEAPKQVANENAAKGSTTAPTAASSAAPTSAPSSAPKLAPTASTAAPKTVSVNTNSANNDSAKASPLAKKIADGSGVDLSQVSGTGPKGRVVKADVEEFLSKGTSSGIIRREAVEFETIPNSSIRQVIARRLLESKQQIPHFYLTIDCNVDALLEARRQINDLAPNVAGKPAYKISVNDLVIKASALALRNVPDANSSWYDDAIVRYNNVDVSVAVATDGGLITPIIFNADQKTVIQISNEMKDLAKRARENKLKPQEFQGGGFSISNLGMFGIKHFSAIVNPPQSCILAVGSSEERVVAQNGQVKVANIMTVTLSVDHRSVDGAVGAQFLAEFKKYIENPVGMLV